MTDKITTTAVEDIFANGGEMGALMRTLDWSATPLGPVEAWPSSLQIALRICLQSRFPMVIWWGKDLVLLYNDAWKPILGATKHPRALGRPGREVWSEIWHIIGVQLEHVLATGQATWSDDFLLLVDRYGYTEEAYFTYSYSPIPDDAGQIGGAFTAVTETTQRVLGERRMHTLSDLAAQVGQAKTAEQACHAAIKTLADNPADIPFALLYLLSADGKQALLCESTPLLANTSASPRCVDLTQTHSEDTWPLAFVVRTGCAALVENLQQRFGAMPSGPWAIHPQQALVLPVRAAGQEQLAGLLVVGVNPCRVLDNDYHNFFEMTAGHIASAISNVRAYEQERKRAEALAELDRAKTAFFSNVSHEFRTPLALMIGPLEDMLTQRSQLLPPDNQEQLQVVHRNSLRLLKLVNTLLDFSRIEAGRVQAVYQATDLAMLTADLAGVFRSAIERAGMHLLVDCPPLPQPVYVDREMWEKIVLNLLSNAFKFTFEGEIAVALRWIDDRVELEVRDTGTGIPSAELPYLFERFYRVQGAKGRTYEGSGIGLSLVQELVRLHGGTIGVRSVVDQGTSFTVSIPTGCAHLPSEYIGATRTLASTALGAAPYVEEALRWLPQESRGRREAGGAEEEIVDNDHLYLSATPAAPNPHKVGAPSSPATPEPSPRILLVDDNADMRDYLKRMLSQYYQVEAVADGIAALAAAAEQVPDLVLTDVMMPRLDGFGLLRELRATAQTRELPIILLSARAGEEARIEGLEAGADDYLIKPFSGRELLARVEANLKLARLRQETTHREQELRTAVQAAKENLESVLASINDQFFTLDREWRYTYVNEQVAQVIGIRKEDIISKSIWELFPDVVGSKFYLEVHRALREQTVVQFEYFYPAWQRWFENRVYPSATGVSVFVAEITERKQAEAQREQLLARERQYISQLHGLTEAALVMNSVLSIEQVLQAITEQARAIIGAHQSITSITINQNWAQAINAVSLSDKYAQWRDYEEQPDGSGIYAYVCQMNQPMRLTQAELEAHPKWRGFGKHGDKHPPLRGWLAAPLMGRDGGNIGLIQLSDKYSGEFTAEDEAMLVQLAQMASVALENTRLYEAEQQARQTAEAANRIKDEFLAVLSHELRSPLNPILGWSKLLQSRKFDAAKTAQALAIIERNAQLQTQLIEDLLDVSRILQGKLTLNVAPVNLEFIVSAALETVRLAAEAKAIKIETRFEPHLGQVLGDSSRLQQVVWNLLSNAVKFTPAGGRVEVQLQRVNSSAQLQVLDTGKGIDPDFLPYVFDYFRQADSATTRKFGGLGLGLAIVRHLVELHGGTVTAESPGEGQGAIFTVRLPLMTIQPQTKSHSKLPAANLDLSGIKVLVVDDDVDSREFIAFVLQEYGATVTAAASAFEALEVLAKVKPDVLVCDIAMPDMDGYMLMHQVKILSPPGGQIPAVAVTAYAGESDQQQALAAGFQLHLPKPVEPDLLVASLTKLVGKE